MSTCVTELQELASDEEDIIEALPDSCESEDDQDSSPHLRTSHSSFRISSPKKQSVRQSLKSPLKVVCPPQTAKPPRDIAS